VKILLIDNFDSFTYNLAHYFESLDCEVRVVRVNEYRKELAEDCDKIVFSPGPGLPSDFPWMNHCYKDWQGKKDVLGVCLGMQALVEFQGGSLFNQKEVKHGVMEELNILHQGVLLATCPKRLEVGLYHSWAVDIQEDSAWSVLAKSDSGIIMAIEDLEKRLFGVQFHPESIMSKEGMLILKNFIDWKS
jgi:anthranilate synthase component 2